MLDARHSETVRTRYNQLQQNYETKVSNSSPSCKAIADRAYMYKPATFQSIICRRPAVHRAMLQTLFCRTKAYLE